MSIGAYVIGAIFALLALGIVGHIVRDRDDDDDFDEWMDRRG